MENEGMGTGGGCASDSCGCTDPCTIGADTFDTDLSQFATTGSPSVSAGSLLMSSGDRVIFTPEPTTADDGVRVQTFPLTADATATMRLIAAWTDANNHLFGELSIVGGVGTIRLGRVVAGVESWMTSAKTLDDEDAELNARSTLTLCYQPGEVEPSYSGFTGSYPTEGIGTGWTDPDSVTSPSGTYAEFSAGAAVTTNSLFAKDYADLVVPPGSTIDGIGVSALIEHDGMDTDYVDSLVRLIDGTGTAVGDNKATMASLNSFETNVGWGGDTDDWNAGLTWSDIGHPNFGVVFQFTNNGSVGNIRVRGVAITVWFTTADRRVGKATFSYTNTASPFASQCVRAHAVSDLDGLKTGISVSAGDWDYTTYTLEYLYHSTLHPTCIDCECEDGPVCTCCESVGEFPAVSYEIDFGAGGWTDDQCGHCDTISGVYVADIGGHDPSTGECQWQFNEDPDCTLTGGLGVADVPRFSLVLMLEAANGECYFSLRVFYVAEGDSGGQTAAAFYIGAVSDPFDCNEEEVTLNRTLNSPGDLCNGTLPGTVTITRL